MSRLSFGTLFTPFRRNVSWNSIRYFTPEEFDSPDLPGSGVNMQLEFIKKLDRARVEARIPFKITSGYRTKEHNDFVGGVKDSSHLTGWAADIQTPDTASRRIILNSLIKSNLDRRIGIGESFIHVDDDPKKEEAYWTYSNNLSITDKLKNNDDTVTLPPFKAEMELIKSSDGTDWSHTYYNIKKLHEKGFKGKGVRVAVLDTGLDMSHASFKTAIQEGRLKSVDARRGKDDPTDRNGHGTWCVSRYISDGNKVLGFAPECTVTSYKVLNDDGSGSLLDVMNGVRLAINDGHHIISTSLGWSGRVGSFLELVDLAEINNVIWVSAAGNDGKNNDIDYPALYPWILSIGSHNNKIDRSSFSDYGLDLDIYSSGERVLGAYTKDRQAYLSGTSMATPSLGALLATVYDPIKNKYNKIHRNELRELVTCLNK